jgi:hypothetical protein
MPASFLQVRKPLVGARTRSGEDAGRIQTARHADTNHYTWRRNDPSGKRVTCGGRMILRGSFSAALLFSGLMYPALTACGQI